ncbi:P-loop NTPase fold protein [Clostridium sp. UBA1652]|uniref:P-loop NTPase fold protein n=1 Tax=Clostridium sp. UBA1652 TaxID=1946348 RepID=UPI00257955AF|nr:P-loop NTPase fold protein [Clostridium sp. UBA1652]
MDYKKVLSITKKIFNENSQENLCIFIDGEWGIGKTYTIDKFQEENKEEFELIRISLFGKENLKQIENGLLMQILPIFKKGSSIEVNSKVKIFGNALKDLLSQSTGIDLDFNRYISNVSIEDIDSEDNDKKIIICIDDLERKSSRIPMKDIMGLVERATSKYNVILVGSSVNFSSNDALVFNSFKEKLVDFEFVVDKLNQKTLESVAMYKLCGIYEKDLNNIIKIFRTPLTEENVQQNNLRLFKKYVDLIYRFNKEINLLRSIGEYTFDCNSFKLDDNLIRLCNYVIRKNFLQDELIKEKLIRSTNYYQEQMINVIENIYKYEEYNNQIIKDYFEDFTEIQQDMKKLRTPYKLSENQFNILISKINKNIQEENIDYFLNQRYLISLYDLLVDLADIDAYENKIRNILSKLYKYDANSPEIFTESEWVTYDYYTHERIFNVDWLIEYVNEKNMQQYRENILSQLDILIDNNNLEEVLERLNKIQELDNQYFEKLFDWAFEKLNDKYEESLWNIILRIINLADYKILEEYLKSRKSSSERAIEKIRLKELDYIASEIIYNEKSIEINMPNYDGIYEDS